MRAWGQKTWTEVASCAHISAIVAPWAAPPIPFRDTGLLLYGRSTANDMSLPLSLFPEGRSPA